jgi:LysM repeat protein
VTASTGKSTGSTKTFSYKVRRGDTLWDLAQKYGTTVSKLRSVNGLSRRSKLAIGQTLRIPGPRASEGISKYYVVKRGDTLSKIARTFGVSMSKLVAWNNIRNPHRLSVGAKLRVSAE